MKKRKISFKKVLKEEKKEEKPKIKEEKPEKPKQVEEKKKVPKPKKTEVVEVVIFPLSSEIYAVPVDMVEEIVNFQELIFVPNLPSYVAGLMELRNLIIPIIDLLEKFGFERRVSKEESSIIIINIKGNPIGFLVEKIMEIEKFRSEDIIELPPVFTDEEKRYLGGLLRKDDKLIVLLNPDGLLTREELASLEELKKERI